MPATTTGSHIHDLVTADLARCGYTRLIPMIRAHRAHLTRPGVPALSWTDPIADAAHHLAAALVHLRRAMDEHTPAAALTYHAVLAVAGGLARRFPATVTVPEQRSHPE